MKSITSCLIIGSLLACADRASPPGGTEAPPVHEAPAVLDTVLLDTLPPDTVMARDTARWGREY